MSNTNIKCPIDYYTENLIFNANKSCWAVFSLSGYDYDFLSDDDKISMMYKTARLLTGITDEAQILIIPVQQNQKEHFKNLRKKLNPEDPLCKQAQNHINLTEDYLEKSVRAKGSVNDYKTYIVVKLHERDEADMVGNAIGLIREHYQYFIKSPMNALDVWLNLDTKDILLSRINHCIKLANNWFRDQNQRIKMQKADVEEVQWIFRRMAFRGLNQGVKLFYNSQDKNQKWKPKSEELPIDEDIIIRPLKRDIVNLFSGAIKSRNRVVTVDSDGATSYQTFLALTNIPDEMDFPGMEWIYMSQQYNSQAEICIHIKAIEYRAGLRTLDGKNREINSQIEHIAGANSKIPDELYESQEYAAALEKEIKDLRAPILKTSVSICLAADNKDLLETKVSLVKGIYEDNNFAIERPLSDQIKLFMQFIPSVGTTVKDFIMPLTPSTLAGGVIGATHELGDNVGQFIGTTGIEGKHVFLDMGLACLKNQSASATFFGNLGYGKSFNANLLVFLTVLYGGYGLIFDPKGERTHWPEDLKIFNGMITLISLAAEPEHRGKMDPYNIYRDDIDLANELAQSIISELFRIDPTADEYIVLLEACKTLKNSKDIIPSMKALTKIIENFSPEDGLYEKASKLARKMRAQDDNGMAMLLFGDGSEEAIKTDNRLNIIQIQNLKLPSPEVQKKDYTKEESLSTVLMMVLSHFAKKFALVKRPVFKIILFDESWALGKTVEGAKLYDYLARMGRSLYTGCIFNGHSVLDIPSEGIKNTITYKFCFHTGVDEEAERMLEFLGLEVTEENKEVIKNLENAQCLFQDLNGRVGVLRFDAVFQDIIDVFTTTPSTEIKEDDVKDDIETSSELPDREAEGNEVEQLPAAPDEAYEEDNKDEYVLISDKEEDINIYAKEEIG